MNYFNRDLEKKRVVIYARVSTEHEAQICALENQLDWYQSVLESNPSWKLVDRYIDEGITGTSAQKRPEFMRMIEDSKRNKFDMVITREVSRFARNTVDTLQYTRSLRADGVEVYFINDNIRTMEGDGELRLSLMATLAQEESRKTSIRVKSGQQTSMDNGVVYGNGNILGYDRVGKEMVINPEQAETVRRIYDWYLDGWGMQKIKKELERLGIKTAMGKSEWYTTVISHILKNSFYCGIITYHKEFTPDYLTQKKIKNYGQIGQTQVMGTHTPIVTVEEFDRVQRIISTKCIELPNLNIGPRKKGKLPRKTVWGKLLVCSCGNSFNTRRWDRDDRKTTAGYQCYSSLHTGSYNSRLKNGLSVEGICRTPMIPEWRLQMMANLIFREYLSHKDKVLALANSMLEAHISDEEESEKNEELLKSKRTELGKLHKKLDAYIEMRAEGELSKELFRLKCNELEPKIQKLEAEIAELEQAAAPKPITDYREKLTVLQYALSQYVNPTEDANVPDSVVEAFVEKIVASPDGFDWYLRFDGDPNDPLHCTTTGHRQSTTKIAVSGNSPNHGDCRTGCHQGRQVRSNSPEKRVFRFPN